MLSKARLKYIKSLQLKKYRKEEQSFVVEGAKSVQELLTSDFEISLVAGTREFGEQHQAELTVRKVRFEEASEEELTAAGTLQHNNTAIAVAMMKPNTAPEPAPGELMIVLDDIRDPGNLGTIIRTADWYGIRSIVASEETADLYNAKTISASMGSFGRVHVYYTTLKEYLKDRTDVYGAFLDGEDIHQVSFDAGGILVIGNESNGISASVASLIRKRVTIPRYGKAESLNAGISAAIILDNIRRLQK